MKTEVVDSIEHELYLGFLSLLIHLKTILFNVCSCSVRISASDESLRRWRHINLQS